MAGIHKEILYENAWRDGNVFSAGLLGGVNVNRLQKGYSFGDDSSIVTTPAIWDNDKSSYSDNHIVLQIGVSVRY